MGLDVFAQFAANPATTASELDVLLSALLQKHASAEEGKWARITDEWCTLAGVAKSRSWLKNRAKVLEADAPVGGTSCYECVALPGKGIGAVALRDMKRGELIVEEKPIITVRDNEIAMAEAVDTGFRTARAVDEPFSRLCVEDRSLIMALHDACCGPEAEKTVAGVFSSNCVAPSGDSDDAILCLQLSRFNHSCVPNVEHIFIEPFLRIIAARDIKKGEELCTNYGEWKRPADERMLALRSRYCFDCTCAACCAPAKVCKDSDARRQRYAELDETIPTMGGQDPARALEMAKEAMQLLKAEDLDSPILISRQAYYAFQMSLALERLAEAGTWIRMAHAAKVMTDGPDSETSRQFSRYARDPENFWRDLEGAA